MSKVIIFGNGQLSQIAHYYLSYDSDYKVAAFTVDSEFIKNDNFENKPLVDFKKLKSLFSPDKFKLFLPISYSGINSLRYKKYIEAKEMGYSFITYINSKTSIYNSSIGENTFILENNTIQPFSTIGNNVILWSGNHIGHHSVISDHCFVSSQVVISGSVYIGENTFLGVNSTLRDNIKIGKSCIIGAGANVTSSLEDETIIKPQKNIISNLKSNQFRKL